MSKRLEEALAGIEDGLIGNAIPMPQDQIRCLEDEVWAELSDWNDYEEATRRFLAWRERYHPIGAVAVEPLTGQA